MNAKRKRTEDEKSEYINDSSMDPQSGEELEPGREVSDDEGQMDIGKKSLLEMYLTDCWEQQQEICLR